MQLPAGRNNGYWILAREPYADFAYNTRLLSAGAVPKSYLDLAKPELKGKLAISGATTGKQWIGAVEAGLGKEKAKALFTQLANQGIHVQGVSGRTLLNLVAKGEVIASPTIFQALGQALLRDGAPVQWLPLEPVPSNAGSVAVAAKAPHPPAALLLAVDLVGAEGQKLLADAGFGGPGRDLGFRRWYAAAAQTEPQYDSTMKGWVRTFN